MNNGAKAAIAVVGIIVALFIGGVVVLLAIGALFVSSAQVQIQPGVPTTQGAVAPALQPQGDVIRGIDGQIVTLPNMEKPVLLNKSREITVEVKGGNLKITPNISD